MSSIVVTGTDSAQIEKMKAEILPLLRQKKELDVQANRISSLKVYGGLVYLCAQWALMARLTWWEFNWDIMEPITYFVTFGTAVIGYTYFALTQREFTYPDMRQAWTTRSQRKIYEKNNFPTDRFFELQYELTKLNPDAIEELNETIENSPPSKVIESQKPGELKSE